MIGFKQLWDFPTIMGDYGLVWNWIPNGNGPLWTSLIS